MIPYISRVTPDKAACLTFKKANVQIHGSAVNKLYAINTGDRDVTPESVAATIADVVIKDGFNLVILPNSRYSREVAPRVAAILSAGYVEGVREIKRAEDALYFTRYTMGGSMEENIAVKTEIKIVTASSQELLPSEGDGQPAYEEIELKEVPVNKRVMEVRELKQDVGILNAERIVAIGRGIKKKEDIALVEELAKAIDAEIACTRPIAVDLGWLPPERQVGLSGYVVKPKLYIAIGISGQTQHIYGMRDSKVVVAINSDKTAPIFQHADYGMIGDLYEIVPELLKKLKQ